MFHGQPYCGACDYEGPDFRWMWHHNWGYQALVQHETTKNLRTVEVPDAEVFYQKGADAEREAYTTAVIAGKLLSGERHVPREEFVRFDPDSQGQCVTALPCPQCGELLLWRHTGIS